MRVSVRVRLKVWFSFRVIFRFIVKFRVVRIRVKVIIW